VRTFPDRAPLPGPPYPSGRGQRSGYKGFWDKLDREKYAKISPEQLASVSRLALRAYDACQAGDDQDARALFERLDKTKF
jgi:hypothetical protein